MITLIIICITALFSAWVYGLKQEVDDLHRQIATAHGIGHVVHLHHGRRDPAPKRRAAEAPVDQSSEVRRVDGMPTWVIG